MNSVVIARDVKSPFIFFTMDQHIGVKSLLYKHLVPRIKSLFDGRAYYFQYDLDSFHKAERGQRNRSNHHKMSAIPPLWTFGPLFDMLNALLKKNSN